MDVLAAPDGLQLRAINVKKVRVLSCFSLTVFFFSLFSLAPGAHRQVAAPGTQRSGAEKLHEYPGKSGTER